MTKRNYLVFCLLIILVSSFLVAGDTFPVSYFDDVIAAPLVGMGNPAAVYCDSLGYDYEIIKDGNGEQGVCNFPDQTSCDDWEFLAGECGQHFSYCAQEGLDTVVKHDGQYGITQTYAVCVDQKGIERGPVVGLMDLEAKSLGCNVGLGLPVTNSSPTQAASPPLDFVPPASFDWRNHLGGDWLTPVRNQAKCGSCWAFSAVAVAESLHNIARSDPAYDLNLSEQSMVTNCDMFAGYQNCCGGWSDIALSYITYLGIPDEGCMPYVDGTTTYDGSSCDCLTGICNSTCTYRNAGECSDQRCTDRCADWDSRLTFIKGYGSLYNGPDSPPSDTTLKQYLVDYGPLAVSVGIGDQFGGYWVGDIYHCTDDTGINHGVTIVGYDDAGGYWIIRNSWGPSWNGDGYYKLAYGECDVNLDVSYGVIDRLATFSDVASSHWAFSYIEAIAQAGLTSGYPDGTYRPENSVTRAEMAVFLLNGMGVSVPAVDGSHPFSDITGHWAEKYIEELFDQGITGGYPDGTYRPDNLVTRAEMAVFLLKGIGISPPAIDGSHPFTDIAAHWAEMFIEELYDQAITGGYPDGTYRPQNLVTRAEMAVFLVNTFNIPLPP